MATLLSMCQEVARQTGVDVPSTIVGNSGDEASRLLGAATRSAKWLAKQHPWRELRREKEVTLNIGQKHYALPDDFDRIIPNTGWNSTDKRPLRGAVSPTEWQWWNNSTVPTPNGQTLYTFQNGSNGDFTVFPTPSASGDVVIFEFISKSWCESAQGDGQDSWQADDDVPRLDDTLLALWIEANFLKSMGMPYIDERSDAEKMLATMRAQEAPGPIIDYDQSPRRRDGIEDRLLIPPLGGLLGV